MRLDEAELLVRYWNEECPPTNELAAWTARAAGWQPPRVRRAIPKTESEELEQRVQLRQALAGWPGVRTGGKPLDFSSGGER